MPNQNADGDLTDVERYNVEAVNAANAPRRLKLYAARTKIHPKRASGDFRRCAGPAARVNGLAATGVRRIGHLVGLVPKGERGREASRNR